jgi:hypothetical protein
LYIVVVVSRERGYEIKTVAKDSCLHYVNDADGGTVGLEMTSSTGHGNSCTPEDNNNSTESSDFALILEILVWGRMAAETIDLMAV